MAEQKIFGYANKITVKQGEEIVFHVNCDGADTADAQLVQLIHGDAHREGPGLIEQEIANPVNGSWQVKKQFTQLGNFYTVEDPQHLLAVKSAFSMTCFIWPTKPQKGERQTIMGRWDTLNNTGFAVGISPQGYLEFWVGNGQEVDYVTAEMPLLEKVWYAVGVSYDPDSGTAILHQKGVMNRYNSLFGPVVPYELDSHIQTKLRFRHGNVTDVPFLIGGARDYHELRGNFVNDLFTGKQDRPALFNKFMTRDEFDAIAFGSRPLQADILAYWDTSVGLGPNGAGQRVTDTGPNTLHAEGVNHPVRCMTGWNWNGKDDCFRLAPEQYGGIEFHPDTVTDCKWVETNRMTIPNDLKSGVYALRLRVGAGQGISEEYIVFFVRPKTPQAKLAFLVPTASYLAYANESLSFDAHIIQPMTGQPPVVTDIDIETYEHREFGLSTYDSYEDGAGVCYSSYLRPVINMRPKYRMSSMNITWQFPADLSIVAWIEKMGY